MFGLFKRNLSEIDSGKYQKLAISTSSNALVVTITLLAHSSNPSEKTFMLLYNEVLALAVCLAQMSVQNAFRLKDGNDIVAIIQEMQRQFRELPAPTMVPEGQHLAVTRTMLDNATTDDFFELVAYYTARDYRALAITDEALGAFCNITEQIPGIIKGAGWTLALLIFQIRVSSFLLEDTDPPQRLLPLIKTAREGCQFMMEKFDRLLS